MGFGSIDIIDMDTIDLSNLNRQFLFREKDIGSAKATTAANAVKARIPNMNINAHVGTVQEKSLDFYREFDIVIAGLDNLEARRYMNSVLHEIVEYEKDEASGEMIPDRATQIPFIDGGTEGFKGHCRVVMPGDPNSACLDCTLDLFPPQVTYPLCTIANTPRLPEHCVEWAKIIHWAKAYPGGDKISVDGDNDEHIKWLYEQALTRAKSFGIKGVTYRLTKGVVKNIIPAVASTNAVIAACCCNEAFKISTMCLRAMNDENNCGNNYMMMNQSEGVYTVVFPYEKSPDCFVCSGKSRETHNHSISPEKTIEDLVEELKAKFQLRALSLTHANGQPIFMPTLSSTTENLQKLVGTIFSSTVGDKFTTLLATQSFREPLKLALEIAEISKADQP